jgi:hypothetical protein
LHGEHNHPKPGREHQAQAEDPRCHSWALDGAEAREILKSALAQKTKPRTNIAERIREIFGPLGGVELEPLPREPMRDPEIG